jgi:hypothetical protein
MSANYKFSLLRASGWTRLGVTGAVAILFATPMLWSLGIFGEGDEALHRGMVFLFAGVWLFMVVGYTLGWAIHGFMVKIREAEEGDGDEQPRRAPPPPPPPVARRPPQH